MEDSTVSPVSPVSPVNGNHLRDAPAPVNGNHLRRDAPPLRRTVTLGDLEAGDALAEGEKVVLRVVDAPFNGTSPQDIAMFKLSDRNIGEMIEGLPVHQDGWARIFDVTVHSDFIITGLRHTRGPEETGEVRNVLLKFLQKTYTRTFEERRVFRWLNDPLLVNDIGSISSQWSQHLGGHAPLSRLVNRTSLQQHPLDKNLYPRDSYLTCAQDDNNRLIVIIVHDVWFGQTFDVNDSDQGVIGYENPRIISKILGRTSLTSYFAGTLDTFAKLLVLDFLFASIYLQNVNYYSTIIYPDVEKFGPVKYSLTKNPHLQVPLGLFEPRLGAKSKDAFKEIEDAEGILRSVNNLVDSIKWVIQALTQHGAASAHLEENLPWLVGLYEERQTNADRALNALGRQLDYLTKRHAIREAKAIRMLTILASIYLPLSLAASILGMQSPIKLLAHDKAEGDEDNKSWLFGTNLLFDFFGVFITLAGATIFILYGIQVGLWVQSNGLAMLFKTQLSGNFSIWYYGRRWRYDGWGGRVLEWVRVGSAYWIGPGICIPLLTVFLMGMLRTSQAAWDTAKWMFLGYAAGGVLLGLTYIGLYVCLYQRAFRRRKRVERVKKI